MKKFILKAFTLFVLLLFLLPSIRVDAGFLGIGKPGPGAPPGSWTAGEHPSSGVKSPIVFIHGLNGSSDTWLEDNDMPEIAFQNGHPTAYVNLHPSESIWTNGELLAGILPEIYDYFGEKVTIVAHSKGGVDSQTAIVYFGADQYVKNVITLGSPHHGSELANLANSSWAWWLAEIVGMRSAGTDSLMTGTMAHFRSETDPLFSHSSVPFSTISGTSWGSFGSVLFFGGLYLSSFGTNDGAVTLNSSRLPGANEIASLRLDHFEINQGHHVFPHLQNRLTTNSKPSSSHSYEGNHINTGHIVRGGELIQQGRQDFVIEKDVQSVEVHLLANNKLRHAQLQSPEGVTYDVKQIQAEPSDSVFAGTYLHTFSVPTPAAGTWKLEMQHDEPTAYLAVATIDGGISDNLQLNTSPSLTELQGSAINEKKTTYTVHVNDQKVSDTSLSLKSIPLKQSETYTMTIDVQGETKDGQPFERTIITNRYVDQKGKIFE
ncbi:esterase/lipase family protein [Alkalihalobacillus pseudalcaliphilus]|uniref:esterase/lipase family protein n=1 Tax=Alkalihalobacillus pseudalcaliphilus TaxID=79884 RepID=UPI00064E14BB|nr:lipase [Alkalihalobacillus pseudalcaliphilus]KMK75324.1 lipase [Alkalihalobacillus pseudalcaliphilus]